MNNNKYAKVEPLSVIVVFSVEVFRCFVTTLPHWIHLNTLYFAYMNIQTTHKHTFIHAIHTHLYEYTQISIHKHTHEYTHVYMNTHTHWWIHMQTNIHTTTNIWLHFYTHTYLMWFVRLHFFDPCYFFFPSGRVCVCVCVCV